MEATDRLLDQAGERVSNAAARVTQAQLQAEQTKNTIGWLKRTSLEIERERCWPNSASWPRTCGRKRCTSRRRSSKRGLVTMIAPPAPVRMPAIARQLS